MENYVVEPNKCPHAKSWHVFRIENKSPVIDSYKRNIKFTFLIKLSGLKSAE